MDTLIPALVTCLSRVTSGEKRLAERSAHKADHDPLLWHHVPFAPGRSHPDCFIQQPRRGWPRNGCSNTRQCDPCHHRTKPMSLHLREERRCPLEALGAGPSAADAAPWRTRCIRAAVAGPKRQRQTVEHSWIRFHHKGEVN